MFNTASDSAISEGAHMNADPLRAALVYKMLGSSSAQAKCNVGGYRYKVSAVIVVYTAVFAGRR